MFSVQAKPISMCTMKSNIIKKSSCSRLKAVQGIGDVVHINVYESLTKRLDSIESKLHQIEAYMNDDPIVAKQDSVPEPCIIESESIGSIRETMNNNENSKMLIELKAQMAEASSEARRKALQARIVQLSV